MKREIFDNRPSASATTMLTAIWGYSSKARFLSIARFRPMREKALLEVSCILHSIPWVCTWRSLTRTFLCTRWFHAINTVTHIHDDVIQWKHFPRYWPFVRGIHRSPVNSPHKGQRRGALMFSLICSWIKGWLNNGEAGDLRRHRAHYGVTVMCCKYHTLHNDTLTPAPFLLACQLRVYRTPTPLDYRIQWRHMSVIASQVTDNSSNCFFNMVFIDTAKKTSKLYVTDLLWPIDSCPNTKIFSLKFNLSHNCE